MLSFEHEQALSKRILSLIPEIVPEDLSFGNVTLVFEEEWVTLILGGKICVNEDLSLVESVEATVNLPYHYVLRVDDEHLQQGLQILGEGIACDIIRLREERR